MRVLVTGGTGLVGNNVIRQLLETGHAVRALIRASADPRPLEGLDVERVEGDIRNADQVCEAVRGCAAVVHAAGYVRIGRTGGERHRAINVDGTRHIVDSCAAAGARLVHISTINALGVARRDAPADETNVDPAILPCPYVESKRAAEQIVQEYVRQGLHATILNLGFILGPWDWKPSSGQMILQVARRWTPFAPWGGVSVGDAREVARAVVAALLYEPPGERFVLGGHNVAYVDLWRAIARISGSRGPWMRAGPLMRKGAGWLGDLKTWCTGREGEVNSVAVGMSGQWHFFCSDRAVAQLGYRIPDLEETLSAAWEWFQRHGYCD